MSFHNLKYRNRNDFLPVPKKVPEEKFVSKGANQVFSSETFYLLWMYLLTAFLFKDWNKDVTEHPHLPYYLFTTMILTAYGTQLFKRQERYFLTSMRNYFEKLMFATTVFYLVNRLFFDHMSAMDVFFYQIESTAIFLVIAYPAFAIYRRMTFHRKLKDT